MSADPEPKGPSRRRLRVRRGFGFGLLALMVVALGVCLWWTQFREHGPRVDGTIDESTLSEPTQLCVGSLQDDCRPIPEVERAMASPALTIEGAEATTGGMQGAISLALADDRGYRFRAKWRAESSASIVNEPVKELAAYHLQRLFLEPADYVIPPVASACIPLDHYREWVDPQAEPIEGAGCVFGYLTYWLVGSTSVFDARESELLPMPEDGKYDRDPQLLDRIRFEQGGAYRRNMAVLNLLTFLVNNGDAHAGQFMLYEEPWHIFIVDSSIAFRSIANPTTIFMQDLSELLVPSIPADVAARLQGLSRSDLDDLQVLEEHANIDSRFVRVGPGEVVDDSERIRHSDGRLQTGLTDREIDGVWSRIEAVQTRLESGALATF